LVTLSLKKIGSKRLTSIVLMSIILIAALTILNKAPSVQATTTTMVALPDGLENFGYSRAQTSTSTITPSDPTSTLDGQVTYSNVNSEDDVYESTTEGGNQHTLAQQNYQFVFSVVTIPELFINLYAILVEWKGYVGSGGSSELAIRTWPSGIQTITSGIATSNTWYSLLITSNLGNYLNAGNLYIRVYHYRTDTNTVSVNTDIARVTFYYSISSVGLLPYSAYVVMGAPVKGSPGPAGTVPAGWIDATAASILMGMIESPIFSYDTNSTAISQGWDPNTGGGSINQPPIPLGSTIVMSGGPFVNGPVAYYDNDAHTTKAENAPVYFNQYIQVDRAYRSFRHSSDDSEITDSKVNVSLLGNHLDYFLIESFHDHNGNQILIIYGYTGYGTFAGALYFKTQLFPGMGNTLSDGYQIVQWYDTDGNSAPDSADTYTVVYTQNWPIPP
jgi:hypothetical protein